MLYQTTRAISSVKYIVKQLFPLSPFSTHHPIDPTSSTTICCLNPYLPTVNENFTFPSSQPRLQPNDSLNLRTSTTERSSAAAIPCSPETQLFPLTTTSSSSTFHLPVSGAPISQSLTNKKDSTMPSHLQALPSEAKGMIMSRLPDLASLESLSLVSKDFQDSWDYNKVIILTKNFLDVNPELFAEAFAVLESSRLVCDIDTERAVVKSFLHDWYAPIHPRDLAFKEVSKGDLTEIARLHQDVQFLAMDFFRTTLSKNPVTCEIIENAQSPSKTELNRIYRGFYTLELFCNSFRCRNTDRPSSFTEKDMSNFFLAGFSAHQNEELACVRDWIFQRLEDMFAEIEEEKARDPPHFFKIEPWEAPAGLPSGSVQYSDVTAAWFEPQYDWGLDLSDGGTRSAFKQKAIKENRMAKGLSYLARLFSAKTKETRRQIFFEDLDHSHQFGNYCWFLSDALAVEPYDLMFDREQQEAFFHEDPQSFQGEEDGPNSGWVWVNDGKVELRYSQKITEPLRKFGYVMWDEKRLKEMGVLDADSKRWRYHRDGFSNTVIELKFPEKHYSHQLKCLRNPDRLPDEDEDAEDTDFSDEEAIETETDDDDSDFVVAPASDQSDLEPESDEDVEYEIFSPSIGSNSNGYSSYSYLAAVEDGVYAVDVTDMDISHLRNISVFRIYESRCDGYTEPLSTVEPSRTVIPANASIPNRVEEVSDIVDNEDKTEKSSKPSATDFVTKTQSIYSTSRRGLTRPRGKLFGLSHHVEEHKPVVKDEELVAASKPEKIADHMKRLPKSLKSLGNKLVENIPGRDKSLKGSEERLEQNSKKETKKPEIFAKQLEMKADKVSKKQNGHHQSSVEPEISEDPPHPSQERLPASPSEPLQTSHKGENVPRRRKRDKAAAVINKTAESVLEIAFGGLIYSPAVHPDDALEAPRVVKKRKSTSKNKLKKKNSVWKDAGICILESFGTTGPYGSKPCLF